MLRPTFGNLGTGKSNLTGFKPDRFRRPDIGLRHVFRALVESSRVRIGCRHSCVGFYSQFVNTDTVVVVIVKCGRELESIKRESMDRVPCTVPEDGRKHGKKTRYAFSVGMVTRQGVQFVTHGVPHTKDTHK